MSYTYPKLGNAPINKYTLTHESSDGTVITVTFEHDGLSDVLMGMQQFLAAVGFILEGQLEIVDEPELTLGE